MRLHIWDDDNPPTVHMDVFGDYIQLYDFPHWVGYEIGDQIQYVTELGTEVYFVMDVKSGYELLQGETDAKVVLLKQAR
jgi:hypothetical protein